MNHDPLELRCRECAAPPGSRCVWVTRTGKVMFRRPHAVRVTDARVNTARRKRYGGRMGR